jgi:hypothetical protein
VAIKNPYLWGAEAILTPPKLNFEAMKQLRCFKNIILKQLSDYIASNLKYLSLVGLESAHRGRASDCRGNKWAHLGMRVPLETLR